MKSKKKEEIKIEQENLNENLFKERIGLICLNDAIHGKRSLNLSHAHVNLGQAYLNYRNLPKQAKVHCEKAWKIQVECLKENIYEEFSLDDSYHQMVLNFVYGRACTLLKE